MANKTLTDLMQKELNDLIKKYEECFDTHPQVMSYFAGKIVKTIQCVIGESA